MKIFFYCVVYISPCFRIRKRYSAHRTSVVSDQITKEDSTKCSMLVTMNPHDVITNDESKRHLKRDSRHTIPDEEPITDWIPEIPFWNVNINFSYNSFMSSIE